MATPRKTQVKSKAVSPKKKAESKSVPSTPSKSAKGTPSKAKKTPSKKTATPKKEPVAATPTKKAATPKKETAPSATATPSKKKTPAKKAATPKKESTTATPSKSKKTTTKTPSKAKTTTPRKKKAGKVVKATEVESAVDVIELPSPSKKSKSPKKKAADVEEESNAEVEVESTSSVQVKKTTIEKALTELKKWQTRRSENGSGKSQLFDSEQDSSLLLQVTTTKYLSDKTSKSTKVKSIAVPHSPYTGSASTSNFGASDFQVCLIVKDGQVASEVASELEDDKNLVPHLAKILNVSELKGEFKAYESRRKLYSEYDMFLADEAVVPMLPKLLGKHFYNTNSKIPVSVKLSGNSNNKKSKSKSKDAESDESESVSVKQLQKQVGKALQRIYYVLPMGVNVSIKLGNLFEQELDQVVENVAVIADSFGKLADSKHNKIRNLSLRFTDSPALPIYVADSLYDAEDVAEEKEETTKKSKGKGKENEEPQLKLSEFEKGLAELALDQDQLDLFIGKKVQKVEKLKKRKAEDDVEKKEKKSKKTKKAAAGKK
ncbi:unnamed protein product [Ambrosiozyma monospora]|uniref:Unnamed protein product n=1 Tax=Ambrosiozyma monospora TaxID=43982 RepID=A0A9W6YQU0_AMBMO|nr:unnamed protein product [Ambrosiozyma monospora]